MTGKIYLNLLLLCGILSEGVIGNLAHENAKASSDIFTRQKRVISFIPGEDRKVPIVAAPFIVHIKDRMRIACVGSILSHHVVITTPICVPYEAQRYTISSTSAYSDHGNFHNVTEIRKHFGNHPSRPEDGVALLIASTPFVYGRHTTFIKLHSGPLLQGMHGTVYGWGFSSFNKAQRGTIHPKSLRSIEVPIMAHRECMNIYQDHGIEISDKDICTYHPQRYCGHNDAGAPLVVDGYLAGVHLWTGLQGCQIDPQYPDVFVILQHIEYKQWIISNVNSIETPNNQQK